MFWCLNFQILYSKWRSLITVIFTGDTVFQVKKSSHSKKVAKELKKKSQKEKESEEKKVKEEPNSPGVMVKKEPDLDYEKIKVNESAHVKRVLNA